VIAPPARKDLDKRLAGTRRLAAAGHDGTLEQLIVTPIDKTSLMLGKIVPFVLVVLGCLMDAMAMIILTVPIIFPVIKELGFDPIWFGVIIVMTVELGLIHPPVGMNIFVIKSVVEDVKISTVFYGVLPFIVTDILRLVLLIAFPIIALWLPSRM